MKKPLEEQVRALPASPGVYLMRDGEGRVIYVGKAASLRHRVASYFGPPAGLEPKMRRMVQRLADFDFILTDSEQEALILESHLVKKYRPHYNARLKDDKSYPYLKVNLSEDWAQVYITRRVEDDGARYFGPYANAGSVRKTLKLVKKLFPFRSCDRNLDGGDLRPCLDYYIGRCLGPCSGKVTKEDYRRTIEQVILFLEGRQEAVVKRLRRQMEEASEKLEFERAAALRDQVQAVERVIEQQKIATTRSINEDFVAFAQDHDDTCVQVFTVREGKLMGREHFMMEGTADEAPSVVMASFIKQFYQAAPSIPPVLQLLAVPEDAAVLEEWLSRRRGARVRLHVPRRGQKRRMLEMALENAQQMLEQLRVKWLSDARRTGAALGELEEALNLDRTPHRVECYDISNIQGRAAVGSMVVFQEGRPQRSHYRRFQIKTVPGADDYAMMREVLRRRFRRAGGGDGESPAGGAWGALPDLLLVDGGKGQLNVALEVLRELEVPDVPVAALAKEREEVFVQDVSEPIVLPRQSQGLFLLQRLRDEAHRFALSYHQRVRRRSTTGSALDAVPGIGPKRRRALLRRFGSLRALREATVEEIAAVPGMTRSLAERVKERL